MKKCKECNEVKELSEFNKDKYSKDGYTSKCKKCRTNRYELKCEYCGNNFKGSHKTQRFCSTKCRGEWAKGENNPAYKNAKIKFNCDMCGVESNTFISTYNKTEKHFCSKNCFYDYNSGENHPLWNGGLVEVQCSYCGKSIHRKPNEANKTIHNYCSHECMGKHKSIININENNPNFKNAKTTFNCDNCNKEATQPQHQYNTSKKHFCSLKCSALYYAPSKSGEKAWNWNADLTEEERIFGRDYKEYEHWRNFVFEKYQHTCDICNIKGGDLVAHHLNGYNWDIENRINVDNGVCLCKNHHKEFHNIYGYGNNTIEQFKEFKNKSITKSA